MKYIKSSLLVCVLLASCAFNDYQSDVADNQYPDKQVHADPAAEYVGEWTASTDTGFRSIKIKEDGKIKVCLSPSSGVSYGKVIIDNERPYFMIKTGAIAKIISMDKDSLLLDLYGKQEKYNAGLVPNECLSALNNF